MATTRARDALVASGVELDALVLSDRDPSEALDPARLPVPPRATVGTLGADGGRWVAGTEEGHWATAALPGPRGDAYGCGDCFAAGLTFASGCGSRSTRRSDRRGLRRRLPDAEGPYRRPARSVSSGA